jgi:hypothetical protein
VFLVKKSVVFQLPCVQVICGSLQKQHFLPEISKKKFDPESAAVLGVLPNREEADPLGQTAWSPWQVEKTGVGGCCMNL